MTLYYHILKVRFTVSALTSPLARGTSISIAWELVPSTRARARARTHTHTHTPGLGCTLCVVTSTKRQGSSAVSTAEWWTQRGNSIEVRRSWWPGYNDSSLYPMERGWMDPRAGLDEMAKEKKPRWESRSGRSARSLLTILTELPRLLLLK